ncbi:hypothetical protein BOTBODRAFT_61001 [Botryobasidium botryosum FD-172 SS1]|uniref:Zn(2)-C6 fungal-type domain-containing protein n=1 Tax=Botryobasidium botryosum (strain FD-172 SS1) TaxID=930990 RepID=A0A067NBV6_BOTB1|nr:hypothetical protein BOTBODRAFT_61001 [Botryobasidium botryosum FD-172 SS1]
MASVITHLVLARGRACLACRARKRRCDGLKPTCTACAKMKRWTTCVYDDAPAPIHDTMPAREQASLRDKIGKLKELIRNEFEESSGLHSAFGGHVTTAVSLPLPALDARRRLLFAAKTRVQAPIADPHLDWWKHGGDVPPVIRDSLIDHCAQYGWHFSFHHNFRRLRASLELPATHPKAPHPALLYAVLLAGCVYIPSPLRRYESVFLLRARQHLSQLLTTGTKIFDFLCASALAGCHLYSKGRMREGHYHISAAARFAVGCGLHKIKSLALDAQTPTPLLSPSIDLIELGDRINMFWLLVCFDRVGSLVLAVPETITDKEISTLWPCPSTFYEDGRAFFQTAGSIRMLDDLESLRQIKDDNFVALRQKAVMLLARTSALSARAKSGDPDDTALKSEIFMNCQSTLAFANSLPVFKVQEGDADDLNSAGSLLSVAFVAAYSAVVQSYGIIAQIDPLAREVQSYAAKEAMIIVRSLDQMPLFYVPLLIGWCVTPVHEFLVRESLRLTEVGQSEDAAAMKRDIQLLLRIIKRVAELFPAITTIVADVIDRNVELIRKEAAYGGMNSSTL